ncbi:MAG: hypothetical protein QG657_4942 [Acidobacteriota bacterium]|nr:hypothetical protein [Acidobacteriota bacterium]
MTDRKQMAKERGLGEKKEGELRQDKPWKRGSTGMYID